MKKVLHILVLLCLCVGLVSCSEKKDNSNLTSDELQTYLEKQGYAFKIDDMESSVNTHYVVCYNNDIWIQQIDNPKIGLTASYKNEKVNDEYANILDKEKNDTKETKAQYDAYLEWLDQNGISKDQLQDVLEYYNVRESMQEGKRRSSILGNEEAILTLVKLGYVELKDHMYILSENDISLEVLGNVDWIQFDFNENNFAFKIKNEKTIIMLNWEKGEVTILGDSSTAVDICVYDVLTKQSLTESCDTSGMKELGVAYDFLSYISKNEIYLSNLYIE